MSTIELVDRQTQALKEIRGFLAAVDAKPFFGGVSLADFKLSGEKACAAVVDAILERHGL
ncbi:hypothetical protein [Mycolicibacter algericus]|uniref:Uncharacterized protein n=2 Tax=Mycolicibacter algericus TaxID=1288388 RepID=A0A7I9YGV2_MYCAL|nr:hypothetical protein [Mycolicibacter algericus]OQZ96939.1 hypothetical protein BST10_10210 [Mycolicibacter algericus DSM 45454]GFG83364.1 hypothetical protein MALGJ_00400 [Mycolicibacter algericus]GFG87897.1 hypothetical protein MALGJ_45730 [Mycolicibacter algericus]